MSRLLLSALRSKLGDYDVAKGGSEFNFECPKCSSGKRKLGINPDKGMFYCFRCSWGGGITDLLDELDIRLTFQESSRVPGRANQVADAYTGSSPASIPGFRPIRADVADSKRSMTESLAISYCLKRGAMTPLQIEDAGWGISTDRDLAHRLIIPVKMHGRLVQYLARAWDDFVLPKEKSGPEFAGWLPKDRVCYGLDGVRRGGHVVLVEGVWDFRNVLRRTGRYCPVALLGHHLSETVAGQILARRPARITFLMDGDEPGEDGAWEGVMLLQKRKYGSVRVVTLAAGQDPDQVFDEMESVIEGAELAPPWQMEQAVKRSNRPKRWK